MTFSFNGPSFRPMIQESQSMKNNGGGGNTGYMYQERKKKQKKEIDVFSEVQDENDEFVIPNTTPSPPRGKILDKIIEKTKDFVKSPQKMHQNGEKEVKESTEELNSKNPFTRLIDSEME